MNDRVIPHSLDAERAVLGAALISRKAWPVVASLLSARDFFRLAHQEIFSAMAVLFGRGEPLDLVMVMEELRRAGASDDATPAYLSSLTDGMPQSANVEHYAAIVREKARLRAVISVSSSLVDDAYAERDRAAAIADAGTRRLLASVGTDGESPITAEEAAQRYMGRLADGRAVPMPTGFSDLDSLVGGLSPGDFVVIAARPSMGKTSLSLSMALNIASGGLVGVYFSLEMLAEKLGGRLLSWRSGVQMSSLERGTATDEDYARVPRAAEHLTGVKLYIYDASRSVSEMTAWCRRLREQHGALAVIVVDYLQLLVPDRPNSRDRQVEVAGLSASLKQLARVTGATVVALAQLSRASDARRDKRPRLSDLRESGAIEQDADLVLMLHRQEMYAPKPENDGIAEVIVAKNRDGPIGVVKLQFEKTLARFGNLAREGGN